MWAPGISGSPTSVTVVQFLANLFGLLDNQCPRLESSISLCCERAAAEIEVTDMIISILVAH